MIEIHQIGFVRTEEMYSLTCTVNGNPDEGSSLEKFPSVSLINIVIVIQLSTNVHSL